MNPVLGAGLAYVNRIADVGTQTYRGLRLSMRRAAASGVSLSANYTLSHCEADTEVGGSWLQFERATSSPATPHSIRATAATIAARSAISRWVRRPRSSRIRRCGSWRPTGACRAFLSARSGAWPQHHDGP